MFSLQTKVVVAVVFLSALIGCYFYGRHDGAVLERAQWQKRELAIAADTSAKLQAAQQALIAKERQRAQELAMVSGHYQNELRSMSDEKDRVIAGLRDGTRRLYIDARCPPDGGAVPGAPAGPGGRDGGTRAELQPAAAEFLVALAAEADAVVAQLTACQAVVRADRAR